MKVCNVTGTGVPGIGTEIWAEIAVSIAAATTKVAVRTLVVGSNPDRVTAGDEAYTGGSSVVGNDICDLLDRYLVTLSHRGHRHIRGADKMVEELVLVNRRDDTITITMNRPQRRNALSLELLQALQTAFTEAGDSNATGVILAGAGVAFSAGHDLGAMVGASLPDMHTLLRTCTDVMNTMQEIPQVVIARVHAVATAAGAQLVAAADLAVASSNATFAAPGGKGGWFCTTPMVAIGRSIGRKQALELALTGDSIDAETALAWGLVNRVVSEDDLEAATDKLLARATRGSAASRAMGKRALHRQLGMDQVSAYDYAIEVMAAASQLEDAQEGMLSFVEKRPALWKHR